jgi:hypothetical protein
VNDNMNSPETETPVVETPETEAPVAEAVSAVEQAEAVVADAQPETPVAETSAPEPEAKGSEKPAPEPKPKNRNVWRLDGYARNKWIGTLNPETAEFDSGYHAMPVEQALSWFALLMEAKDIALTDGKASKWTAIRVACVAQQRIDE